MGLATTISLVVLGVSLVFLAGAYGYQYFLLNQINRACSDNAGCGLRLELERQRAAINLDEIVRLKKLDFKLDRAQSIINSHTSLIPLLELVENNTVHSVKFTDMQYSGNSVELSGEARGYEDAAVLSEALQATGQFGQISFNSFNFTPANNIEFSLTAEINQDLLLSR